DASERVVHLESAEPIDARTHDRLAAGEGLTVGPYVADVLTFGEFTLAVRRHVLSFFQGNRYLLRDLVSHVVDQVPAGGAAVGLYAGAGLFSIAAAVVRSARVTAVEGDRYSAADLAANAAKSGSPIQAVPDPAAA